MGAQLALECIAQAMDEAADLLDATANVYDEVCSTLEVFERKPTKGQE